MASRVFVLMTALLLTLLFGCFSTDAALAKRVQPLSASVQKKEEIGTRVLTAGPDNLAVVAGQRASFRCISNNSDTLTWVKTDLEALRDTIIIFGCALNPDAGDNYAIENLGFGRCDLVVKSASAEDGQLYRCLQMISTEIEPPQSAILAVLDTEPKCSIDKEDPRINDRVTLTCDVSYTENISPMIMTWTDEQGNIIPSSIGKNRAGHTTSSHSFTVTNFGNLPEYTCTTKFSAPVGLPSTATNTPDYTYSWTSPALVVKGELVKPPNSAEQIGKPITLPCRLDMPDVSWSYVPIDTSFSINIVYNCQVAPSYQHMYRVNTEGGACHLVIDSLTVPHAGGYTCSSFSVLPASAQLIALAEPECSLSPADANQIQLTCGVTYSGNFAPVMTWTDESGAVLPSTTETTRTRVESRAIVTPVENSQVFTSTTHFEDPIVDPPGPVDPATNAPAYTYTWTVRLVPGPTTPGGPGTTGGTGSTAPGTTVTGGTTGTTSQGPDTGLADCGEIKKANADARSGVYPITVQGRRMEVYCDMDTEGGGWTVFQRRQDGSVKFYNDWATYQAGFGRPDGEFWLGNDNLAVLTGAKQNVLRIELEDWVSNRRYAQYSDFKVLGASDQYQLSSLGTFSGTAVDSLTPRHLGMKFSTFDEDWDTWASGNCAEDSRGAWWYWNCRYSNLNGEYNNTQLYQGVNWAENGSPWDYYYSLKFTEMKIRPANYFQVLFD